MRMGTEKRGKEELWISFGKGVEMGTGTEKQGKAKMTETPGTSPRVTERLSRNWPEGDGKRKGARG